MKAGRPKLCTGAAMREAADAGLTRAETAQLLGVTAASVYRRAKEYGLTFTDGGAMVPPKSAKRPPDARAYRMKALYQAGHILEEIGRTYGITRERVRQILTGHFGFTGKSGGGARLSEQRRETRRAVRDEKSMKRWGCSYANYRTLRGKPTRAFIEQRRNAGVRGIGWELTLHQWWSIWQQSGHWAQRGRGQGYCMCRKGDVGPYAIGNVFIATSRENSSTGKGKKSGLPMGVSKVVKGSYVAYIAHRCVGGKRKHLGSFKAPELAHAAYLAADPGVAPSLLAAPPEDAQTPRTAMVLA